MEYSSGFPSDIFISNSSKNSYRDPCRDWSRHCFRDTSRDFSVICLDILSRIPPGFLLGYVEGCFFRNFSISSRIFRYLSQDSSRYSTRKWKSLPGLIHSTRSFFYDSCRNPLWNLSFSKSSQRFWPRFLTGLVPGVHPEFCQILLSRFLLGLLPESPPLYV